MSGGGDDARIGWSALSEYCKAGSCLTTQIATPTVVIAGST